MQERLSRQLIKAVNLLFRNLGAFCFDYSDEVKGF